MTSSPTFSDLLAQPGSSEAPAQPAPTAAGGVVINNQAKMAALSAPLQQARVRVETSRAALQRLAMTLAKETRGGF